MQVWLDDPDALGAEGWQLEGVRLSRLTGGFNISDEHPERATIPSATRPSARSSAFERIGNEVDPATGLPRIVYTDNLSPSPGAVG
jgi:hypothetical protein